MDLLWKFLDERKLTIDTTNISSHLNCALCSTIMKNSTVTTCGCTFCNMCIKEYLGEDTKPCPACEKDNVINVISYNIDVSECKNVNKHIARSFFNCPQNECEVRCELQSLLEHLTSCNARKEGCIMKNMGCTSANMNEEIMEQHLKEEMKLHFQLLVENIDVLRHWMNSLQVERTENADMCNNFVQIQAENKALTLRMNENTTAMQSAVTEIGIMRTDITQMRGMIQESKNEIARMKLDESLKNNEICCLKKEQIKIKGEIANLKKQIILENQEQISSLRSENAQPRKTMNSLSAAVGDLRTSIKEQEDKTKSSVEGLSRSIAKLERGNECRKKELAKIKEGVNKRKHTVPIQEGGVIQPGKVLRTKDVAGATAEGLHWTVTPPSQCHNQDRWSEPFTISGYSMRVRMWWGMPNNIGAGLYLLSSVADTGVAWPMRLRLRLIVADPDSGTEIWSREIHCDHGKSRTEKYCIGDTRTGGVGISLAEQYGVTIANSVLISVELV